MSHRCPLIDQGLVMACVFIYLFFSGSFTAKSWAVGNIHFGRAEVQPAFRLKETYDDNIEVDDSKVGHDWITTCSASLKMEWPFRQHLLTGDWLISFPRYARYPGWNFQEHRLSTEGSFLFGRGGNRFELDLSHLSIKSSDAPELGQSRQKRSENYFTPGLKIGFKDNIRFDLKHEIRWFRFDDKDDQLDNRHENCSSLTVNLQSLPKTTAFISIRYGRIEYEKTSYVRYGRIEDEKTSTDSDYWGITPGLRWDATAKLSGQLSGGYKWKDYDSKYLRDINTWIAMADLTHRLSDYTSLSLGLDIGDRECIITQRVNEKKVKSFHNYILYKTQLSWKHQLTYKVETRLSFTCEYDDYQGDLDRQNTICLFDCGVTYQLQEWLVTDLGLQYKRLFSQGNSPQKEYSNNVISLSLGLLL